jgi:hypothetical protein
VTHVLLLVTVLVRRAYAAERIWAAFTARADGLGHRRIAATLRVPAATVRGWLRRAAERLEVIRSWFWTVAVTIGVDVRIPDGSGCVGRDAVVAVETATAPIGSRFAAVGLLGAVTPARVAVAASSARLLAPGWPPRGRLAATRIALDVGTGFSVILARAPARQSISPTRGHRDRCWGRNEVDERDAEASADDELRDLTRQRSRHRR